MSSHVASGSRLYYCWEQRYLDDQLVSSCLSSPAMIVGWGEVSEVDVETLGGSVGGRDTGWEREVGGIPLLLSFTPHSSDTHNLTCLSLTVFSQSHVCHANHIAALIQCGKKVDMLTYPDKCCLILIRHPSIAGSYKELATLRYECHKKLYSYPNLSDRKILDDIKTQTMFVVFKSLIWWKGTTYETRGSLS